MRAVTKFTSINWLPLPTPRWCHHPHHHITDNLHNHYPPSSQRGTRTHHLSVVGKRNSSVLVPVHLLHCDVHLEYYTNRSLGNPPELRHSHIVTRPKHPNHHIIKSLMLSSCSIIPSSSMTMMILAMTIQIMMITSPGL